MSNKLIINSNTISFGDRIFKTANVNSVGLKEVMPKSRGWLIVVALLSAIGFALTLMQGYQASGEYFFRLLISFAGATGAVVLFFILRSGDRKYRLFIQTSSGSTELFEHKDLQYVNSIRMKILSALNKYGTHNVNIDNRTVINANNVVIQNYNHYSGMSEADKLFLKEQFAPALERMQKEIDALRNTEMEARFAALKNELTKQKPNKSILEQMWRVLSDVRALGDLAEVVEKAINLF